MRDGINKGSGRRLPMWMRADEKISLSLSRCGKAKYQVPKHAQYWRIVSTVAALLIGDVVFLPNLLRATLMESTKWLVAPFRTHILGLCRFTRTNVQRWLALPM